jgi:hypothetical protein
MAESFFATLERELLSRRRFRSQAEAKMAVEWIEGWCNPHRRHSSLGYRYPVNRISPELLPPAAADRACCGKCLKMMLRNEDDKLVHRNGSGPEGRDAITERHQLHEQDCSGVPGQHAARLRGIRNGQGQERSQDYPPDNILASDPSRNTEGQCRAPCQEARARIN